MACLRPQRLKPRATKSTKPASAGSPLPAVQTAVWRGFGGESPQGDLVVVAREFIRRAEMRRDSVLVRFVTVLCETQ